tara:strand:+ start:183 stop:491 length:309 start_codon:yes stop_codon:yes gene_type:complete
MRFQAILNLYKDVGVINGEGENEQVFDKDGNQIKIDETKVSEEVERLQADYDLKQYQRDRKYPELGEQLDLLFHDMTAGKGDKTGEWYKAVNKVKTDHSKPE